MIPGESNVEPASKALSVLDLLQLLDRSNCGECREATCLAFAAAVLRGEQQLDQCPRLTPEAIAGLAGRLAQRPAQEWTGEDALRAIRKRFQGLDLAARAERLGGFMQADRLVIHCLGKVFQIDRQAGLHSDCHQNPWLHVPLLSYVLDSAGRVPAGQWARFAELGPARPWARFFAHRCEQPLEELAARDPALLLDIFDLFAARRQVAGFEADATFLLLPLPRVPFLFAYREPQADLPGGLSVFIDRTAEVNLDPESLFRLGSGMAQMFARIAERHGLASRRSAG
jgi:hypothetical protein